GATRARREKTAALAELLRAAEPAEIPAAVGLLLGKPRQGRIGIGWRTLESARQPPAESATLTVADVDEALTGLAALSGAGSTAARAAALSALTGRATAAEQDFL